MYSLFKQTHTSENTFDSCYLLPSIVHRRTFYAINYRYFQYIQYGDLLEMVTEANNIIRGVASKYMLDNSSAYFNSNCDTRQHTVCRLCDSMKVSCTQHNQITGVKLPLEEVQQAFVWSMMSSMRQH